MARILSYTAALVLAGGLLASCGEAGSGTGAAAETDITAAADSDLKTRAEAGDAAARNEIARRAAAAAAVEQKSAFDALLAANDEDGLEILADEGNPWALHRRGLARIASGERILGQAGFVDIEAAAESGHAESQLWVGTRMAHGKDGYPLKPNSGLMMVEKAANQGHVEAMVKLAELYETDQFMADPAKALVWYGKAAEAGSEPAREALARLKPGEAPAR